MNLEYYNFCISYNIALIVFSLLEEYLQCPRLCYRHLQVFSGDQYTNNSILGKKCPNFTNLDSKFYQVGRLECKQNFSDLISPHLGKHDSKANI